jgi:isoprenylcysteine carboxyl methyltransferase (ICMT) family protein YpbQ
MHTHFTLWINLLYVEMICISDLYDSYDCVNSYIIIILYVFDLLYILLSGDSLRDLWNVRMYVLNHEP